MIGSSMVITESITDVFVLVMPVLCLQAHKLHTINAAHTGTI